MMYSAVPATGIVNRAVTRQTLPQRALRSVKQRALSSHSASRKKKIEKRCQQNKAVSKGTCVHRMVAAITAGNQVALACDRKKTVFVGNSAGSSLFSMPGR